MTNIPQLPQDGTWSHDFIARLFKYVDSIIENPSLTVSKYREPYERLTAHQDQVAYRLSRRYAHFVNEAQGLENQNPTPEAFVNARIAERRYAWVDRFFVQAVLARRLRL